MAGGILIAAPIIFNINTIYIILSYTMLERMSLAAAPLALHNLYRLLLDILFWLLYFRLIDNLDIVDIQRSMVARKEALRRVEKATETHYTRWLENSGFKF